MDSIQWIGDLVLKCLRLQDSSSRLLNYEQNADFALIQWPENYIRYRGYSDYQL